MKGRDDVSALPRTVGVAAVPTGAWAVGVSGGADSVALLRLLCVRRDLSLHVVHLDHQARGGDSAEDAGFVADLAHRLNLPCTIARRDQLEPTVPALPRNVSSRFRRLRLALFERVANEQSLRGVILGHQADDQAETVLSRLLRGSGPAGLVGMGGRACVGGLVILRPLLEVRRETLHTYLRALGQPWRTDASNASPAYQRSRLRALLEGREELFESLTELSRACRGLRDWARSAAPVLPARFAVGALADLPAVLAREAAGRWLRERGVPAAEVGPDVVARLLEMSRDAASAARVQFPGRVRVKRRKGEIFRDEAPAARAPGSGS